MANRIGYQLRGFVTADIEAVFDAATMQELDVRGRKDDEIAAKLNTGEWLLSSIRNHIDPDSGADVDLEVFDFNPAPALFMRLEPDPWPTDVLTSQGLRSRAARIGRAEAQVASGALAASRLFEQHVKECAAWIHAMLRSDLVDQEARSALDEAMNAMAGAARALIRNRPTRPAGSLPTHGEHGTAIQHTEA